MGAMRGECDASNASNAASPVKKRSTLLGPWQGPGGLPGGIAEGSVVRPDEQIAHVGEDLDRAATGTVEIAEVNGGVFKGAGYAVSQSGQGVAEEVAFFIHRKFGAQAQRLEKL